MTEVWFESCYVFVQHSDVWSLNWEFNGLECFVLLNFQVRSHAMLVYQCPLLLSKVMVWATLSLSCGLNAAFHVTVLTLLR